MTRRATTHDVARAAGVSLSTVDRVLNDRIGVREGTRRRVQEAIDRLGYRRDAAAAALSRDTFYRLLFLLPDRGSTFIRSIAPKLRETADGPEGMRTEIHTITVPMLDAPSLVTALDQVMPDAYDGVALVGTDARIVRDAIDRAVDRGVHVVTLVSDVPGSRREHYVGIDNVAAGRTAASLLGRFIGTGPGAVQVVLGSRQLRDHIERLFGFEQVLGTEFPHLDLLPVIEGFEDNDRTAEALQARLASSPDLRGIYIVGGGKQGVLSALRASGPPSLIRVVGHDATPHARQALMEGYFDAVLNQDPGHETRSAVRVLKCLIDGTPIHQDQERICIDIFLRDNLP